MNSFQPLREMAAKWRNWIALNTMGCIDAEQLAKCADELDVWCDAAEAQLKNECKFADEAHDEETILEQVRRVLLGEKEKA